MCLSNITSFVRHGALSLLFVVGVAVSGCGQNSSEQPSTTQKVVNSTHDLSSGPTAVQAVTAEELFPWLSEVLELNKHAVKNLHIASYDISPNGRYMAININNSTKEALEVPFYRFVVVDAQAKRILFPSNDVLLRNDLGNPYISAKFDNNNKVAIAYGMRTVAANVISLSDGTILKKKELNVYDIDEINAELTLLLASQDVPTKQPKLVDDLYSWLYEELELNKRNDKDLHVASYDISPNGRYVAINISNQTKEQLGAPFYRFVVVDAEEKRIVYPGYDLLLKDDLGFPYRKAKYGNNNQIVLTYGGTFIVASVISLADGSVMQRKELGMPAAAVLDGQLSQLLHETDQGTAVGAASSKACSALKERMKRETKALREFHSMAFGRELVTVKDDAVLPLDFKLSDMESLNPECAEDVGLDDCGGDVMTISYFSGHTHGDFQTHWEDLYLGSFDRLQHGVYQGMSQESLRDALGKPYRLNEYLMSYKSPSADEEHSPEENIYFYFKQDRLYAISKSNGEGC